MCYWVKCYRLCHDILISCYLCKLMGQWEDLYEEEAEEDVLLGLCCVRNGKRKVIVSMMADRSVCYCAFLYIVFML